MTTSPIDPSALQELADTTGADFAKELVETFLTDAPNMVAELKAAVDANDPDMFRRAAHSIKSNASLFGAHALADHARSLELSGLSADTAQTATEIATLEAEYDNAATELRAYLNG